jgi:hypothetical protein
MWKLIPYGDSIVPLRLMSANTCYSYLRLALTTDLVLQKTQQYLPCVFRRTQTRAPLNVCREQVSSLIIYHLCPDSNTYYDDYIVGDT